MVQSEAGHSLPAQRCWRGEVQGDRGRRRGEAGQGGLLVLEAPEEVQQLQSLGLLISTWTVGELRQLWTLTMMSRTMLEQQAVELLEA